MCEYCGTENFKMSFYHNSLDKDKAIAVIKKTNRPILYTRGYTWKNPTTLRKPISKEEAESIIRREGFVDITANNEHIHVNTFSSNDLF